MGNFSEAPLDRIWAEYGTVFQDWDDLTLVRWMAQTLGQLQGRAWRYSHPLLRAYCLAAQIGHDRQVWLKRLASAPPTYSEATCCRAPLLPLFTRDILEGGLLCQHCGDTCIPFEELAPELQAEIRAWAERYAAVHAVAHWDDAERKGAGNYDMKFEEAATQAERLLAVAGAQIAPKLLESLPAIVWEDQDECLEVHPEDVEL